MSDNKVTFGLKNTHYAVITGKDEQGNPIYGTPKPYPGAVSLSPDAEGDQNVFYADDIAYYVVDSNNGYSGDFEAADVPDDFKIDVLGYLRDANGMLVEVADAVKKDFALMGEITGDAKQRKFIYYNVTSGRPTGDLNTKNDSTEPDTKTVALTMTPIEISGKQVVKGKIELNDTNAEKFNSFFDAVLLPDFVTVPVTGITLNKAETSLAVGADETLVATIAPANATDQGVNWISSDPTKATVDSAGKVTGIAAGTATIVATAHGDSSKIAACTVTVTTP
jgi:phi13 family phage major tail protein